MSTQNVFGGAIAISPVVITIAVDPTGLVLPTANGIYQFNNTFGAAVYDVGMAAGVVAGQRVTYMNVSAAANTVTINKVGTMRTVAAGNPAVTQWDVVEFIWTGTAWYQAGAVSANS